MMYLKNMNALKTVSLEIWNSESETYNMKFWICEFTFDLIELILDVLVAKFQQHIGEARWVPTALCKDIVEHKLPLVERQHDADKSNKHRAHEVAATPMHRHCEINRIHSDWASLKAPNAQGFAHSLPLCVAVAIIKEKVRIF